jgi:DNA-binding transcriptional LysR family regulator
MYITEIGLRFYEHCRNILYDVERAEADIREYKFEPQGVLRLSAPTSFVKFYLYPVFMEFLDAYPKIAIDMHLSTTKEDLIAKGIDAELRLGDYLDPGLISVKLIRDERIYCTTAGCLASYGTPTTARELSSHHCLVSRAGLPQALWPIRDESGDWQNVPVSGRFSVDNSEVVMKAVLSGRGIGRLPRFLIQDHLDKGTLIEIFPESRANNGYLYLVYHERKNLPLKTRVFIDFIKERLRTPTA